MPQASVSGFRLAIFAFVTFIFATGFHETGPDFEGGTLILIGATRREITIAADSGSFSQRHGVEAGHAKIFPVGHYSACSIFRNAVITLRADNTKVDFGDELSQWIIAHPSAEFIEAAPLIAEKMRSALAVFIAKNLQFMQPPLTSRTSLICLGFSEGKPAAILNDIVMADANKPVTVASKSFQLPPGFFMGLGLPDVAMSIVQGDDARLDKFRNRAPVKKYRTAVANKAIGTLTALDLISISRVCLAATESAEGRTVDPDTFIVVPPNHFVVISSSKGFRSLPSDVE
jgi:hypothetical protein